MWPASTSRIALLCYERDHDQCHRSCILDVVQRDDPALSVGGLHRWLRQVGRC
ncbi:MAG: DUF488 domain-containing protein [Acidimicrobiia bacterium]|nr:DUF488 domain-containing protein [Acidimicrobiia bacterium]